MKILVTGSNGLLGQKILDAYKRFPNIELIATSRGENRNQNTSGYKYESLDITDREQVQKVISAYNPDVVINTAALTNVDACETQREECWRLNVDAVTYLVNTCEQINAHFIHLSTDFIFDGKNGPYSEEDVPNPLSYYGESKLAAEEIVKKASCPWSIIRTVLVIGVTQGMSRSNIVLWVKESLEKGKEIKVVNDQFRSPTLAEDLATGCLLAAQKKATGIYNISGGEQLSVLEIAHRVAKFFKLNSGLISEVSSEILNQTAKRPPVTGFNISKAKDNLGYSPHSFDQSIKIIYDQSISQKT